MREMGQQLNQERHVPPSALKTEVALTYSLHASYNSIVTQISKNTEPKCRFPSHIMSGTLLLCVLLPTVISHKRKA